MLISNTNLERRAVEERMGMHWLEMGIDKNKALQCE